MQEHLIRQYDLIPEKVLGTAITIIGAGAIGGWTTLSLAKMGFTNLTVWDFDSVSIENMNSQFFRFRDIGTLKTTALQSLVLDFTNTPIAVQSKRYEGGRIDGIVICAVDSMEARQLIFDNMAMKGLFTKAVIDPRMGAENALLYVYDPKVSAECETYKKSLYASSEAVQEPCTAKATVYTASLISGLVVKAVKDLVTDQPKQLKTALWDIKANHCQLFNKTVA